MAKSQKEKMYDEQLEKMSIDIASATQTLLKLQQQYDELVASKPTPEQMAWEPKKHYWSANATSVTAHGGGPDAKIVAAGLCRETEPQAWEAHYAMAVHALILAYRDEHEPNFRPMWENGEKNYFVYWHLHNKVWTYTYHRDVVAAGTVYMPMYVAAQLAEDLNSGRVKLPMDILKVK